MIIQFLNVTKGYGNNSRVLNELSFSIEKGEFIFLTGSTGSGKSTAIRLLFMEEFPDSGRVLACGFDSSTIKRRRIAELRRKLGIIIQDFEPLADRTIFENVALALRAVGTRERLVAPKVIDALAATRLGHKAAFYPEQLSGSEKWRLRIARAVVNGPLVLLADDPFGNFDAETSAEIFSLLLSMNLRGTTVLIAAHETEFVRSCPQRKITLEG